MEKPADINGSLASTIGVKNPIRYRGYYYDTETGLYYLQSRYYDPETCRFINADSLIIDIALSVLEIAVDFYSSEFISVAAIVVSTSVATVNPILGAAMGVTVLLVGDALWEEIKSPGNV